jgi:hypothetical protein
MDMEQDLDDEAGGEKFVRSGEVFAKGVVYVKDLRLVGDDGGWSC